MQCTKTKSGARRGGDSLAPELGKHKPSPEKPYPNWTELRLSAPVVIGDGVGAIMEVCGGDSHYPCAWRETKSGIMPLFSIFKTKSYPEHDVSSRLYNVDPHVVCTRGFDTKTDRFWVSPSADLTSEKMAAIKAGLGLK